MKHLDLQSPKVRLRGGFADRHGIAPENAAMQVDSLDERSRVALVNALYEAWDIPTVIREPEVMRWNQMKEDILAKMYLMLLHECEGYR